MLDRLKQVFQGRRSRPDVAAACKRRGNEYLAQGDLDMAERCYRDALAADPAYAEALNNLGHVLTVKGRFPEAQAVLQAALASDPTLAEAANNLGTALRDQGLFAAAAAEYERSLALRPDYAVAVGNLCAMLIGAGRNDEAEHIYRRFLATHPDAAAVRYFLALCLLGAGKFDAGWRLHEARYDGAMTAPVATAPPLPFPQWTGQPLEGKSLLVWYEQGFGDAIQFVRYVPVLKQRGLARIGLACPPPLRELFESLDGVDHVYAVDAATQLHFYDHWVLPLSIPLHCGTTLDTIPASLPYLSAPPARIEAWRERLPPVGVRVGVVWRGNRQHDNDAHRSLPGLATLAPLWEVPGVSFVSLQKGAGEDEALAPPPGQSLTELGSSVRDFADAAAIVSQLDLVICVDTAIAHLAGALGKPCWVMLPWLGTDWRWLQDRGDSPWYPGVMRLFRQAAPHDWVPVVAAIARALRAFVAAQDRAQ